MNRPVYVSEDSIMRVQAYMNANLDEVYANCEECGARIPVELTLCTVCYCMAATCDDADGRA